MALFTLGKKKKEEPLDLSLPPPDPEPQAPSSPVEQVVMMKQQGYTNGQITQLLQSQGYTTTQISDAINQGSLSGNFENPRQETGMSDYGQSDYEQPYTQQQPQPQNFQPPHEISNPMTMDDERIQEITEAIIEEKWQEFAGDMRRVIEWKDRSEDRIAKVEQQLIDLRLSIDSLTKSLVGKITSYDQNILDVGTEIKAMEKVFQKVLPTLTENVNKLDRMAKGYREPVQKSK
ncbi:MAG: hypothetical protein AABX32_00835 [Nanoarchaeota archaeon]